MRCALGRKNFLFWNVYFGVTKNQEKINIYEIHIENERKISLGKYNLALCLAPVTLRYVVILRSAQIYSAQSAMNFSLSLYIYIHIYK